MIAFILIIGALAVVGGPIPVICLLGFFLADLFWKR